MTDDTREFERERRDGIRALGEDHELRQDTMDWMARVSRKRYSYHFDWLGCPIIQFPADIVALQEIIWRVRPRLVIETGVARGGSLVFYASMLELVGDDGRVLGIDVDIRPQNRSAVEGHAMGRRIDLLDGSSTDPEIVREVGRRAADRAPVMVVLDSDHSHEHVLRELRSYAPLVTPGSYLVVCDTSVEYTPEDLYTGRPWRRGNSPATAVAEFLSADEPFIVDEEYDHKLLASVCPGGYLRRLRPNENRGASR